MVDDTVIIRCKQKTQPVWKDKLRSVSKTFRDVGLQELCEQDTPGVQHWYHGGCWPEWRREIECRGSCALGAGRAEHAPVARQEERRYYLCRRSGTFRAGHG